MHRVLKLSRVGHCSGVFSSRVLYSWELLVEPVTGPAAAAARLSYRRAEQGDTDNKMENYNVSIFTQFLQHSQCKECKVTCEHLQVDIVYQKEEQ